MLDNFFIIIKIFFAILVFYSYLFPNDFYIYLIEIEDLILNIVIKFLEKFFKALEKFRKLILITLFKINFKFMNKPKEINFYNLVIFFSCFFIMIFFIMVII